VKSLTDFIYFIIKIKGEIETGTVNEGTISACPKCGADKDNFAIRCEQDRHIEGSVEIVCSSCGLIAHGQYDAIIIDKFMINKEIASQMIDVDISMDIIELILKILMMNWIHMISLKIKKNVNNLFVLDYAEKMI